MKNTPSQWVVELNSASASHSIGGKASNLLRLKEGKFPIPRTWVIPWEVYQAYQEDQIELVGRLKSELTAVIHPQARYAVRSSADIEDGKSNSFAGQFKTALNVQGVGGVLTVVWSIWATATAGGVGQYAARKQTSINQVRMAVIIQEMVQPVYSGVAFSRNPMTGTSEIVIEAVAGEGTALVQDGVTPFRWVSQWGKWIAVPDESPIPLAVIEQVAAGTRQIGKKMKLSADLEWVYDGKQVFWVQMREITALGEVKVYSNRISREVMPGIIKPLIWSINIPLVNTVWIRLLEQMVGHTGLKPQDLARSFYYRSYFNMGAIGKLLNRVGFPSEGVEMMMGVTGQKAGRPVFKPGLKTMRLLPRLLFFFGRQVEFCRVL
jgi:phosphoenolpyruvate synthase/pyruvate phosphate dikinase